MLARPVPQASPTVPGALASLDLPDDRQATGLTQTLIPGKFTLSRSAGAVDNGFSTGRCGQRPGVGHLRVHTGLDQPGQPGGAA